VLGLLRLARLTGRNEYERAAASALRGFWPLLRQFPTAFGVMLGGLDLLLHPGAEVVLFDPGATKEGRQMRDLLTAHAGRDTVVVIAAGQPDSLSDRLIPLTNGRTAIDGQPTAYVCRGHTCLEPVHTADGLDALLEQKPPV
jgi:uncharacterized protein YyaL (SSP411 family)